METERIVKSAASIKDQIAFWYLKYRGVKADAITGQEGCTLFDKAPAREKDAILRKIQLNPHELPVLLTRVREEEWIINTTEYFIQVKQVSIDKISYKAFYWHKGAFLQDPTQPEKKIFSLDRIKPTVNPKVEGQIIPFGIELTSGEVKYWDMPTGWTLFTFWNVTKKCEMIGRRYQIEEYRQ